MALSNRGVLRAVSGEIELAREDFLRAIDLKAGMGACEYEFGKTGEGNNATGIS